MKKLFSKSSQEENVTPIKPNGNGQQSVTPIPIGSIGNTDNKY